MFFENSSKLFFFIIIFIFKEKSTISIVCVSGVTVRKRSQSSYIKKSIPREIFFSKIEKTVT